MYRYIFAMLLTLCVSQIPQMPVFAAGQIFYPPCNCNHYHNLPPRNSNFMPSHYPMPMTNGYNPAFYNNNNNTLRYSNNRPNRYYRNVNTPSSFSDINALEKYTLNRNYSRESDLERLQRLEMQAFGAVQSGDINTRYDNVRNAILSRPKQNYKTTFLGNLANYFSGQMTGYTPNFDNDPFFSDSSLTRSSYPTTYGTQNIDSYSTPWGKGYRVNNYGTGSSSGVRILD